MASSNKNSRVTAINVPAGEIKVGYNPKVFQVLGLGSCVAVTFYYPKKQYGGLAHILLPDSSKVKRSTEKEKYADIAISKLSSASSNLDNIRRLQDLSKITSPLVG